MKKTKTLVTAVFLALFSITQLFAQEKTAVELFSLAEKAENLEKWYEASQFYMECLQKNPVYGDAWFHLAQCSYQLGEFDLVLEYLENAEKYSRDDSSILNLRGMTLISMGKFSDARAIFESILNRFPNDINARFGLAELDLFDGRISGAEKQYNEALRRQSENRKALLSLALVSAQLGNKENAKKYISQALKLYSDESEVHYLAAVIDSYQNDLKSAEKHCRIAVEVDGNNIRAYELLSKIRYEQGFLGDVIDYCDFIIGRDRNNTIAWYMKGAALLSQNKIDEAIDIWSSALFINPLDEIMRAALEIQIAKSVSLEDERRAQWAVPHIQNAREYARRYDSNGTTYEYQRALKINPSNSEARMNFAGMLELNGLHESYLEQLLFINETRDAESVSKKAKQKMDDTIEAYESLLQDSLAKKWDIQPFYLDKTRWNIGIYYVKSSVNQIHIENNRIAADFASEMFQGLSTSPVATQVREVKGFGEAYQTARTTGMDYFILISVDEGNRDINLDYTMYSARTGSKIKEDSLYSTGNYKYSSVFSRFRNDILGLLPIRGKILNRDGKTLLVDIGRSENIREEAVFDIVRKNAIQTAANGKGVVYDDSDILGFFTVTTAGEEVSEGFLEYKGFYDRINTGDEIVLIYEAASDESNASGQNNESTGFENVPNADSNGRTLNKRAGLTAEDLGVRKTPSFVDLIRSIY